MWDPVTECGILTDFDVGHPVAETRPYVEPGDSMLLELLELKAFCNWRSERVGLDRIEPFVWFLVEMCLGAGGLDLRFR